MRAGSAGCWRLKRRSSGRRSPACASSSESSSGTSIVIVGTVRPPGRDSFPDCIFVLTARCFWCGVRKVRSQWLEKMMSSSPVSISVSAIYKCQCGTTLWLMKRLSGMMRSRFAGAVGLRKCDRVSCITHQSYLLLCSNSLTE
jgi:hypothetical protein